MPTQYHHKITRSEKKLFVITGLVVVMLLAFGAWRQWVNAVPDVIIPTPEMSSPNAYDFYVKAGAAIIPANPPVDAVFDTKEVPKSQWKTRYPTAKKEAWLRQNSKALSLLREGFKYPCHVPPERLQPRQVSSRVFRDTARMLVVESHVRSERGDWGGAAESTIDGFELGHDIAQGGVLFDFLIGSSVHAFVRRELWEILPNLTAAEAKTATRKLEKHIQTRVPYANVLQEEKLSLQAKLLATMRSSDWDTIIEDFLNLDHYTGAERAIHRWRMLNTPRRVVFNNFTNYMDDLISVAKKPYTKQAPLPPIPDDFYNHEVAPVFVNRRLNHARHEAANALVLVGLALRAYKLEHNHYPRTLNELVPLYLQEIPHDPFGGGEPLYYKLLGPDYSLYSIGPDGVDNNGRAIENIQASEYMSMLNSVQPDSKGDIVAGINQ